MRGLSPSSNSPFSILPSWVCPVPVHCSVFAQCPCEVGWKLGLLQSIVPNQTEIPAIASCSYLEVDASVVIISSLQMEMKVGKVNHRYVWDVWIIRDYVKLSPRSNLISPVSQEIVPRCQPWPIVQVSPLKDWMNTFKCRHQRCSVSLLASWKLLITQLSGDNACAR